VSRSGSTTRDRTRGAGRGAERRAAPVTPLPDRRRERRRRPGRRRPLLAVLVVLGTVLLGWLLWAGPLLAVGSIQVDGVSILPEEQVREAAGVAAGTPLLRVDVDAAEAAVARLPQVAAVEVTRGWPDRLVITVQERVPVAVVGDPGRRTLVDTEGVLFDTVTGDPPPGVVPLDVPAPGPDDPTTRAALTAVEGLPADLRGAVAGVTAETPEEITMVLLDGTLVVWGDAGESGRKGEVLAALVEQISTGALEPAGTIDVSAPGAVVLR
jgi:cell division protein FtsQ